LTFGRKRQDFRLPGLLTVPIFKEFLTCLGAWQDRCGGGQLSEQGSCWHSADEVDRLSDAFRRIVVADLGLPATHALQTSLPAPLVDLLFGVDPSVARSGATPPATYAVLDAAKYRFLAEFLETSGLPHRCLFKGKAAEEMRDVAPWLVALEPDNRLTRALFTEGDGPAALWRFNLGPIIRCAADFDAVWRHFRKFIRLRRADADVWVYFRFWEPHVLPGLAAAVAEEPLALAQDMLAPINGAPQSWTVFDTQTRRAARWSIADPARVRQSVLLLHPATTVALAQSTIRAQMTTEINRALQAVGDDLRRAYAAEPRLAVLWSALQAARFDLANHRIDAIRGYLTMVANHRQEEAWRILMRQDQGAKVRLWHLERAMEEPV
jgi:hypothetical protein